MAEIWAYTDISCSPSEASVDKLVIYTSSETRNT
jgi:hypothetical protein